MNRILQELKQTVSASRLNTFHQCRLKFFFRYVAEIQKPGTPALFVGKPSTPFCRAGTLRDGGRTERTGVLPCHVRHSLE